MRTLVAVFLLLTLVAVPACRSHHRPQKVQTAPARVSPVVRGSGSGLETWWWVVSDQRIERRPPEKSEEERRKPRPQLPAGPERSAFPDDFVSRKLVDVEGEEAAPDEEDTDPEPRPPAYTITDDKQDLEAALEIYAHRSVPLPEDVRRRWLESGLRIYSVPRAELDALEHRLRLVGPVQRQWMGETPSWTDIAEGPWEQRGRTITVAGDSVPLGPGRLRLVARAWTAPLPGHAGPRPGMRLEIVPQHEPVQTEQAKLLIGAGLMSRSEQEAMRGFVFDRLALGATLESDDAIIIVPFGHDLSEQDIQPFREPARMLGDAMLAREATETRARARAVIVLVPRLAERFELLGR